MIMKRAYLGLILPIIGLALGCDWLDNNDDKRSYMPQLPELQVSVYNGLEYEYNYDGTLDEIGLMDGYDGLDVDIDFSYTPFRIKEEYTYMDDIPFGVERFEYKNIRQNKYGYITDLEVEYYYSDGEIEENENMVMEFEYDDHYLTEFSFSTAGEGYDSTLDEEYRWSNDEHFTLKWKDFHIYEISNKYRWTEEGKHTYDQDNGSISYGILYSQMGNEYRQLMPAHFRVLYLDQFIPLLALAQNSYFGAGPVSLPSKVQVYNHNIFSYNYVLNNDGSVLMVEESNNEEVIGMHYFQYVTNQGRSEYVTLPQESMKPRPFHARRSKQCKRHEIEMSWKLLILKNCRG